MALQDIYTHEGLNSAACNASADLEGLGPGNILPPKQQQQLCILMLPR